MSAFNGIEQVFGGRPGLEGAARFGEYSEEQGRQEPVLIVLGVLWGRLVRISRYIGW